MRQKLSKTAALGGILLLFFSFGGFREEQEEKPEMVFDTCSEYMVMSLLENEMEKLSCEQEKYTDQGNVEFHISKLPSYVTKYPKLYATEISGKEGKDTSGSGVQKKIAYLTFDDGPSENTIKVLDVLKEAGICATFFLIGEEITPEREEIVRRIVAEGHAIGLHTQCHDYDVIYRSVEDFLADYEKVFERICEVAGKTPAIYRFPGGSTNRHARKQTMQTIMQEMERRGFCYYDWNVSAEDAVGNPTYASIRANIFKDVFRYSEPVILMHDSNENKLTVQMLPGIIEKIKAAGYEFDTLTHRKSCQFGK